MQSEARVDTRLFRDLIRSLLSEGISVRFHARGRSMFPAIRDQQMVQVDPVKHVNFGDVVLLETADGPVVHRVGAFGATRGDCCLDHDAPGNLIGKVSLLHDGTPIAVPSMGLGTRVRRWLARWSGHF